MDGLFHYLMKSKIKTRSGWATLSPSSVSSLCSGIPFPTFELNVQALTLIRLSVEASPGRWWSVSLILSRWWHNMIYDIITLSRISSRSCRRSSGLFMFTALNLIFNKFMSFSLSAFYDSASGAVALFMLVVYMEKTSVWPNMKSSKWYLCNTPEFDLGR